MDERDMYVDLLNYMIDVGHCFDDMLRYIDSIRSQLKNGLSINGVPYKDSDLNALREKIIQKKDIVWNTLVPSLRYTVDSF